MNNTFEEHISAATVMVENQQFEEAIKQYQHALELAQYTGQKIDIHNYLGRLHGSLGNRSQSIQHFEDSLNLHESVAQEEAPELQANKAVVLNNLGALYANEDLQKTIQFHKAALQLIQGLYEQNQELFTEYLGNTHYSLGGAYFLQNDFYQANKSYQQVVDIYSVYEKEQPERARPLLAITYFQLGGIASEQDKAENARTYYHKALYLYEKLMENHPDEFRPYLASVLNNLGVINRLEGYLTEAKKNYEKTIQEYEILAQRDPVTFLPYYATSLNSLGNVYADSWTPEDDIFAGNRGFLSGFGLFTNETDSKDDEDMVKAEKYYQRALDIYNQLADQEPETYTHYVATTLHNLGVLYDENKAFDKAEGFYQQALNLRKKLAEREPQAFDFDVASTQMNLVTMYQTQMEKNVDLSLKAKAVDLLENSKQRLDKYIQDEVPTAIENMRGDIAYFTKYFANVKEADLVSNDLKVKADLLNDDALSTLDMEKRLAIYANILDLYREANTTFPDHKELTKYYLDYCADTAETAISAGNLDFAKAVIDQGLAVSEHDKVLLDLLAKASSCY
jgi:tetratricopeptide (TPR) repeat protein